MDTAVQSQKHGCSCTVEGYFLIVLLRPRTSLKNPGTKRVDRRYKLGAFALKKGASVHAQSYCIFLGHLRLLSLGGLLFSERKQGKSGSGGEEWGEELGRVEKRKTVV